MASLIMTIDSDSADEQLVPTKPAKGQKDKTTKKAKKSGTARAPELDPEEEMLFMEKTNEAGKEAAFFQEEQSSDGRDGKDGGRSFMIKEDGGKQTAWNFGA